MQLIRGKIHLKQIVSDHFPAFSEGHPTQITRPGIPLNIDKMLKCGTEEMGYHHYRCETCTYERKVPHTCKSRFCPRCGVAQTDMWIERYTTLFAECAYQHVIFAPPHEFEDYFRVDRRRYLNCLYTVVNRTLSDWYTFRRYLPGFLLVMHTFGRSMSWHVHIHVLITCGGLNEARTGWIGVDFIRHDILKERFRNNFLTEISRLWQTQNPSDIPPGCGLLFRKRYQEKITTAVTGKTWYVHVGERLQDAGRVVRYIGRYTKRPAIAESKILGYDGYAVTFTYKEHRMTKPEVETLSAPQFLERLLPHIPDVNFRVVRYAGFYANRLRGTLLPLVFALKNSKRTYAEAKEHLAKLSCWWRRRVEAITRIDPLYCDICLIPLTLFSVVYSVRKADPYG
ncbi:MAG: transposase [Acidobacteria bacterium]|nr:transposase [Acidobacteriota bacterium]